MMTDSFKPAGNEVILKFSNRRAAEHFLLWMCDSGEQDYWEWMRRREKEESTGDITALGFNYHEPGYGTVIATCGRMDKDK